MPESVYKVIELVGTSSESWEKAAAAAVEKAGGTVKVIGAKAEAATAAQD